MATTPLGSLLLNQTKIQTGNVTPAEPVDQFTFDTSVGSLSANLDLSIRLTTPLVIDAPPSLGITLQLYQDLNNNGQIDTNLPTPDRFVGISIFSDLPSQTGMANIGNQPSGRYIAQIFRPFGSTEPLMNYEFRVSRAASGSPSNLAVAEKQVGNLSQDLTRQGLLNRENTTDSFAFSLDAGESVGIKFRELGNPSGDIRARVVQDRNSNGIVDRNEIVARSTESGDLDSISPITGAGNYLLQVYQVAGSKTRFRADFDHSVA